jgi:hypothetical protein
MAHSRDESLPSRIELVVLACLSQSKPPSDVEIGEAIQQLAVPAESADGARRRAAELVAGLVQRAWVTDDGSTPRGSVRRSVSSPRKLTDSGKRVLRTAFNLSRVPTWAQVRDKHLPALALGMSPGSEPADGACTESRLIAAVLSKRFAIRDAVTPMAVCDAMIADALGMPRGKLTLDRMRAHVVARGMDGLRVDAPSPGVKGFAGKLAAAIACSLVGASDAGAPKHRMARAIARRWVCGDADPLRAGVAHPPESPAPPRTGSAVDAVASGNASVRTPCAPPEPPPPRPPADVRGAQHSPNLLDVVRAAIPRIGSEGRFGEKVYVSAIWRSIERDRKAGGISLDSFKRWLVTANRDGKLVLARADLIGAMDAKQVTESEITDRGATFHFVLDPRNGASASQQESHAG